MKHKKILVGLGNPGAQYDNTRHNIGFEALDALRGASPQSWRAEQSKKLKGLLYHGTDCLLLYPQTFMNNSGESVQATLKWFQINDLSRLLVIHDDISLPLGRIRWSEGGGAGGQHGIESMIKHLGKRKDFARLRIGIGPDPGGAKRSSFVLSHFRGEELALKQQVLAMVVEGLEAYLRGENVTTLAQRYNAKDLSPEGIAKQQASLQAQKKRQSQGLFGKIRLPSALEQALKAKSKEHHFYLVGGALRDHLLGQPVLDWDLVVFACPKAEMPILCRALADEVQASFVELDPEHGHYRLVASDGTWQADLSYPRGETIEEDLRLRDLNINSIAYDLTEQKTIDPLGGIGAVKRKKLALNSYAVLQEDPLRCLRAFRFQASLGFELESQSCLQLEQFVIEGDSVLQEIAAERILQELWQLLGGEHCFESLQQMGQLGLLEEIIPEMTALRQIPPNTHHHLPLWEHTLELVRQLEQKIFAHLPDTCREVLLADQEPSLLAITKLACLLHDIAKPATWQIQEDGRHSFHGHDVTGAEMTASITQKLRLSKQHSKQVCLLVRYHLMPFQLAPVPGEVTDKASFRLIRKLESKQNFAMLIALAWADLHSVRGERITDLSLAQGEARLRYLWQKAEEFYHQEETIAPLLSGSELRACIEESGLAPTSFIKEILNEIRDLQLEGTIQTSTEARVYFLEQSQRGKRG